MNGAAPTRDQAILQRQLQTIAEQEPFKALGAVVTVPLLAAIFAGSVPAVHLTAWVVIQIALWIWGLLLWRRWERRQPGNLARWRNTYCVYAGLYGLAWGSAAGMFHAPAALGHDVVMGATLLVLGALAVGFYSAHLGVVGLFLVGAMGPYIVHLWVDVAVPNLLVAALGSFALLYLLILANVQSHRFRDMFGLQFDNERLAHEAADRAARLAAVDAQRQAQQAQLLQSSKLASLGEIATGLAHEMNQPLNIIRMAADSALLLMADGAAEEDFMRSQLGLISGQTVRMAKIIDHMRVFGRKDQADAVLFSPVDPVVGALALMQPQLRLSDIALEHAREGDLPQVRGWPLRVEQVLLNLINNGRDAILAQPRGPAPGPHGRITLRSRFDAARGEVLIAVEDTGGGIPVDQLNRVFDPFFTTKDAGKGTGLGLSISYAIIADMGGRLTATNGPHGAVFTIALPAAMQAAA